MSEQIVITGGAGFIGSNLALRLLGAGERVTVLNARGTLTVLEALRAVGRLGGSAAGAREAAR